MLSERVRLFTLSSHSARATHTMNIDDILGSMKAKVAPSSAAPPSHSWTSEAAVPVASPAKPPKLDASNRVTGGEALDYRFRCGALRLTEAEATVLCKDCTMAFALNSSNWLAADAEPRCALERLARAIFERHTAGVPFNPATSGAEWWAQVRGGGHRHEGIEFHWDVDEHFCDLPGGGGVHVHPHLSTVTYLTAVGAPTLILDAGAPTAASPEAVASVYGPVRGGALSYPRLGKTIVFDGAKLHGAVPCPGRGAPAGTTRVTFLVNVWLGHRPFAVEALPARLAASMSQQWRPHPTLGAFSSDLKPPPKLRIEIDETAPSWAPSTRSVGDVERAVAGAHVGGAAAGGTEAGYEVLEIAFGRNEKLHALRVLLPPRPAPITAPSPSGPAGAVSGAPDSYRLIFGGETSAVLGPNARSLKCDRSGEVVAAAGAVAGANSGLGAGKKKKRKLPRPDSEEESGAKRMY